MSYGLPDRISVGSVSQEASFGMTGGFELTPDPVAQAAIPNGSQLLSDIHNKTVFSLSGFERPRIPHFIGETDLSSVPDNTIFFGLPIKFPYTEYRIPNELRWAKPILQQCISYEAAINPHIADTYAYLTVYRTLVESGQKQLAARLHSDGIQGRRVQPKVAVEHGYAAVDRTPTRYFIHPFNMSGIDVNTHLMDAVFEAQADRRHSICVPLGQLVLFDAFMVHGAEPAAETGMRTFFKLMCTTRQYDRIGNAYNKLFAAEYERQGWQFAERPIPPGLIDPYNP